METHLGTIVLKFGEERAIILRGVASSLDRQTLWFIVIAHSV